MQYGEGRDTGPMSFWRQSPAIENRLAGQRPVQCVKISCKADIQVMHAKQFVPLKVAEYHPAMTMNQPCEISVKHGLPILMRRYPADPVWRKDDWDYENFENDLGKSLLIVSDPGDPK